MSSLLKYRQQQNAQKNGDRLFWARAAADGAPFRGPSAPLLTEDEFDAQVVRVADFKTGFFDMTVEEESKKYAEVMDRCANGWFRLIHVERFLHQTMKHYVEWAEYYFENGSPAAYDGVGRNG